MMRRLYLLLPLLMVPLTPVWPDDAHIIVQKGRTFRPGAVAIRRGETLTFTNQDSFIHQIYSEGLFDTEERAPGQNVSETFTRTGTFEVRCHIHPTMRLIVHIQ